MASEVVEPGSVVADQGIAGMKRNALIDGWRGLSVFLVIIGHLTCCRLSDVRVLPLRQLFSNHITEPLVIIENLGARFGQRLGQPLGPLGVGFFFVISGFLITSLLLKEEQRNGSINLPAFYVRRVFRIMPAFYAMLLATVFLAKGGVITLLPGAAIRSALYTCNINMERCSWWLAHTWSLSAEEQFYLIWPSLFLLKRRVRLIVIAAVALASPVATLLYGPFDSLRYIGLGALIASSPKTRSLVFRFATRGAIAMSALALVFEALFRVSDALTQTLNMIRPLLISIVLFGTLSGSGPFVRIVSNRIFQAIGLVSYSLYLWQQMSLAPLQFADSATGADVFFHRSMATSLLFLIPALLSFFLIERPLIRVGHRLSGALIERRLRYRCGGSERQEVSYSDDVWKTSGRKLAKQPIASPASVHAICAHPGGSPKAPSTRKA